MVAAGAPVALLLGQIDHKDPNAAACAAATVRQLASRARPAARQLGPMNPAVCRPNADRGGKGERGRLPPTHTVVHGAALVAGGLEKVVGLPLRRTHPHCRVELARAMGWYGRLTLLKCSC